MQELGRRMLLRRHVVLSSSFDRIVTTSMGPSMNTISSLNNSMNNSTNNTNSNSSNNSTMNTISNSSNNSTMNIISNSSNNSTNNSPIHSTTPTIPNSPPPDLEGLLRHIKDPLFVLAACKSVLPRDRNQTVSLLRFALTYTNNLLRNRGFFSVTHSVKDPLATCVPANYSYSPRELNDDRELRSLVRYKLHFAVTLLKMRLYKAVLTAGERGLLAYDWREFQTQYKNGSICALTEQCDCGGSFM